MMNKKIDKILKEATKLRASMSYSDYENECDLNSALSTEELNTLSARLKDEARQKELSELLEGSMPQRSAERLVARLTKLQKREEMKLKRTKLLITISSVAAAVLAVSFLVYNHTKHLNTKNVEHLDLHAEILKPTIITPSGDSLILNTPSTSSSKLVSFVNTNVKTKHAHEQVEDVNIVKMNQLVVPTSTMYTLELSDGTVVRVNSGSRLLFPSEFSSEAREVELIGEAFFEVTKSSVPFRVKCNDATVQVYGTAFNLSTNESNIFSALLIEGSVGVTIGEGEETKIKPLERLVYNELTGEQQLSTVDPDEFISWTNNEFLYKERPLPAVLNELEAWYSVSFNCTKELNHKITCRFSRNNTIDEILNMIEQVTDVKFIKTEKYKYDIE